MLSGIIPGGRHFITAVLFKLIANLTWVEGGKIAWRTVQIQSTFRELDVSNWKKEDKSSVHFDIFVKLMSLEGKSCYIRLQLTKLLLKQFSSL